MFPALRPVVAYCRLLWAIRGRILAGAAFVGTLVCFPTVSRESEARDRRGVAGFRIGCRRMKKRSQDGALPVLRAFDCSFLSILAYAGNV